MKSLPKIWRYVVSVKSTVKILSIFVAFLEKTNFNNKKMGDFFKYFVAFSEYLNFSILTQTK